MKRNLRHTVRIARILLTMFVKTSAMLNAYGEPGVQNPFEHPHVTISATIRPFSTGAIDTQTRSTQHFILRQAEMSRMFTPLSLPSLLVADGTAVAQPITDPGPVHITRGRYAMQRVPPDRHVSAGPSKTSLKQHVIPTSLHRNAGSR